MLKYKTIETPLGQILLGEISGKLCMLEFAEEGANRQCLNRIQKFFKAESSIGDTPLLNDAQKQLALYFAGKLKVFNLPLAFAGTEFQQTVWKGLLKIPYGKTVSYGWLAEKVCTIKASRAVGRANGSNPISIIVPCHRVIGANGSLVGYGGQLWRKKWLLEHEGALQPMAI